MTRNELFNVIDLAYHGDGTVLTASSGKKSGDGQADFIVREVDAAITNPNNIDAITICEATRMMMVARDELTRVVNALLEMQK